MKPKAFLPSTSPWPGSSASVPAPAAARSFAGDSRPSAQPLGAHDLEQLLVLLDTNLREHRTAPKAQRLEWMNLRHRVKLELEARNPIPEAELRLIAERLARKAQSGFSPANRQQLVVRAETLNKEVIKLKTKKTKQAP